MDVQQIDAFTAFEQQLRTLCLNEFPCGQGNWRYDYKCNPDRLTSDDRTNTRFDVTLKDHPANVVKIESLEELIKTKKSPWKLDYSWSNEAKDLRKIAVQTPWKIDDKFVLRYFKTLRILDKNVDDVDEQLLHFKNLEELCLSANNIVGVNSHYLPQNLKVLELCANQISDLSGLVVQAPPLVHLGLGSNKIAILSDYLSGSYWPQLLSLDLGHNDLTDLLDVVKRVTSLPKLRNLVLQGNPLSLVPAYRGYTIDSLRNLTILDDIRISADEKHHFKGLARRKEFITEEAHVILEVEYISGIPCPEEITAPDDFPEYPKIERRYLVEFSFPSDTRIRAVTATDILDDEMRIIEEGSPSPTETSPTQITLSGPQTAMCGDMESAEESDKLLLAVTPHITRCQELSPMDDSRRRSGSARSVSFGDRPPPAMRESDSCLSDMPHSKITLTQIRSPALPWEDEVIEYKWAEPQFREDLVMLRDFLKTPMTISIIEEKILGYPPEDDNESAASPTDRKAKDKGGKGKVDKKGKEKEDKSKKKNKAPDKRKASVISTKSVGGKDKKKKKGVDEELVKKPPEFSTLATFTLSLETFLASEYVVEQKFSKILESDEKRARKISALEKKRVSVVKKKDIPKDKKDKKDKTKKSANTKESPKSPKSSDKSGKGKKGDKSTIEEDEELVIPPLEVKVAIRLHHWTTAMDSVKEEKSTQSRLSPQ